MSSERRSTKGERRSAMNDGDPSRRSVEEIRSTTEWNSFAIGRYAPSVPAGQFPIATLSAGQTAAGSTAKEFHSVVNRRVPSGFVGFVAPIVLRRVLRRRQQQKLDRNNSFQREILFCGTSSFLTFLVRKLPTPQEEDLAKGILDAIDMDSYRVQKRQTIAIALADENAEIDPAPITAGGHLPESELDRLSNIIKEFNERFSHLALNDRDKMINEITGDISNKVADVPAYRNAMKFLDKQSAKVELQHALGKILDANVKDYLELYKNYKGNASFSEWLIDAVFALTCDPTAASTSDQPPV